jgi:DNA-binding winged helix-turn-helix (wHTH) protein
MSGQAVTNFPFPPPYIRDYAADLFRFIKKGESVTSVWVATAGRRVVNRFIIDNITEFANEVPDHERYLLVYIEPLDLTEESQPGYLRLIGQSFIEAYAKEGRDIKTLGATEIFADETAPYSKLLEALRSLISAATREGLQVVLFLGEIDELSFVNSIFCNNLRSIWNRFAGNLHYVFLIKDVRLFFGKNFYSEDLGYLFFQNILYMPVSRANEGYLIDLFEKKSGFTLSAEARTAVSHMCDGHPYLLKLAIESLSKKASQAAIGARQVDGILDENYEIRSVSDRILSVLTDKMKRTLLDCSIKKLAILPADDETKCLLSLGLIVKNAENIYEPFCQLFRDAILKKALPGITPEMAQKSIAFDTGTNAIIISGKSVEEHLTRQEYQLLAHFLKEPNRVFSRDEIAEAIWSKESYEKYSDWAIDQLMSKLRKKLGDLGADENMLVTVRGRGYKFTQAR